jgi:hypothetical protein
LVYFVHRDKEVVEVFVRFSIAPSQGLFYWVRSIVQINQQVEKCYTIMSKIRAGRPLGRIMVEIAFSASASEILAAIQRLQSAESLLVK